MTPRLIVTEHARQSVLLDLRDLLLRLPGMEFPEFLRDRSSPYWKVPFRLGVRFPSGT